MTQGIMMEQENKTNETRNIEVEAVTIEEAIRKALRALNANKEAVTIKVLKEEHKGLFGMQGAELAKVRVFLNSSKTA